MFENKVQGSWVLESSVTPMPGEGWASPSPTKSLNRAGLLDLGLYLHLMWILLENTNALALSPEMDSIGLEQGPGISILFNLPG